MIKCFIISLLPIIGAVKHSTPFRFVVGFTTFIPRKKKYESYELRTRVSVLSLRDTTANYLVMARRSTIELLRIVGPFIPGLA